MENIPLPQNRIVFVVVGLIVMALIVIGGLIFISSQRSGKSITQVITGRKETGSSGTSGGSSRLTRPPNKTTYENPQESVRDEISKEVLLKLDKTRTENGAYSFGIFCTVGGVCASNTVDNRVGVQALWAQALFYSTVHDPQAESLIDKDIEVYLNPDKVRVIQNDLWNCKLMYSLIQKGAFSQQQKDGFLRICKRGSWLGEEEEQFRQKATEGQISQINLDEVMDGKKYQPEPLKDNFYMYAAAASDAVYEYMLTQDQTKYNYAISYFNRAIETYTVQSNLSQIDIATLGIASVDMYRLTKNDIYLEFSKFLYRAHPGSCSQLQSCVLSASWFNEMYKENNDAFYKQMRNLYLHQLINRFFDKQGYLGLRNNYGMFYTSGKGDYQYPTLYNGLLAGLLVDIK
jgi:hypothetical protein